MNDKQGPTSNLVWILGAVTLGALLLFIITGGDFGGTKKVQSDADLPKVTSPTPPPGGNTGSR